ncbi:MAG: hypothetical protein WCD37_17040 [Chloroflexia bacterium]
MQVIDSHPLGLTRSGLTMVVWGLALIVAGVLSQWASLPYPTGMVVLWGAATIIGLVFQGLCQVEHQPLNFYVWVGAIGIGWLFTLYVLYVNGSFYPELAPAWFLLLGVAYVHTGMKIDTRFYVLAGLHFALAALFELGGRAGVSFLFIYGPVIFGLLAGIGLVAGAYYARVSLQR